MWISLIELSISNGSTWVNRIGFNLGENYENGNCLRVSQGAKRKNALIIYLPLESNKMVGAIRQYLGSVYGEAVSPRDNSA